MMMRKVVWLTALMALTSALALAQNSTMKGAKGWGAAGPADSDQIDAFFSFGVAQMSHSDPWHGDRSWQWGWFNLTTRQENQVITVTMYRLTALTVDTNARTASFSGQAVLVVRTRNGFERIRGTIQVSVSDRRSRDGSGDPDTLSVSFVGEDGNERFSYSGEVKRGDIAVFEHSMRR